METIYAVCYGAVYKGTLEGVRVEVGVVGLAHHRRNRRTKVSTATRPI